MHAAGSRVSTPIRPFAGRIAAVRKDAVHRTDTEGRTPPGAVTMLVEPFGRPLNAERARPIALVI
jgi:hypothetical protein